MIPHRISSGGIVIRETKVLLVHHVRSNEYDFWVMPGGGLKGNEGIFKGAEREVWEETGFQVAAQKIAYVEELIDQGVYVCKFWLLCVMEKGRLSLSNRDPDEDFLKAAAFFSQDQVKGMNVYPAILKDEFWQDLVAGFPLIRYLGYHS